MVTTPLTLPTLWCREVGKWRQWRSDSPSSSWWGVALKQTQGLPAHPEAALSAPFPPRPAARLPPARAEKSSALMGHIPQATSGGSGHMLPSSTAWGLETPTPSKPADGGRGAADQWEEHSLPALPHLNAVETEPPALLTTGSHTPHGPERAARRPPWATAHPRAGKSRAGCPGRQLPRPLPGHGTQRSLRSFLRRGQRPGDQERQPEVSKLVGEKNQASCQRKTSHARGEGLDGASGDHPAGRASRSGAPGRALACGRAPPPSGHTVEVYPRCTQVSGSQLWRWGCRKEPNPTVQGDQGDGGDGGGTSTPDLGLSS